MSSEGTSDTRASAGNSCSAVHAATLGVHDVNLFGAIDASSSSGRTYSAVNALAGRFNHMPFCGAMGAKSSSSCAQSAVFAFLHIVRYSGHNNQI
jgi:hypothetical protein